MSALVPGGARIAILTNVSIQSRAPQRYQP
jgi:hypothetical protein